MKHLETRIRRMTEADIPIAHALDMASFSLSWPQSAYQYEVTSNPDSLPLVIEVKNNEDKWCIAGIMVIWLILDEAHIGTLAISKDYRRIGLARKLLAEGLLISHEKGAEVAYLEVRQGNIGAQELYKRFGFTIEGTRPRYYKDNNEDALLLTLRPLDDEKIKTLIV